MLPLFPLITYYHQADMSKYFFAHDYGMNVLRHLPTKTILFNQVDYNVFPLWYLQYVENVRKDIPVFSVLFLTRPWYVERMLKIYPDVKLTCNPEGHYSKIFSNIIYNNIKEFKIYFTHDFATQKDPNALMPANAIKEGILYTLKPQKIGKELPYIYRGVYDTSVYKDVWAYEVIGVYGYYYAWLGQEALQQNQYKEAIKYLNKALELDKNNASYYPNLALAYNSIQKYDDAISILEDAIELHPDKHELLYHLALTYYYKKEYDKSILYAEKALMNNLDDVQIYNLLGICYYLKGKRQKAVKIFQKSLKINPHLEETKKYLYMTQQDMIKKSP
jgi:tetratricopeptide (TPR) repeat protein